LTQEALAERAGISTRAVIDLERGVNRAPRRDTLELLATALNLSDDEMARWERLRRRLSLRAAASPDAPSRPSAQRATPTNLPAELDVLIGRDDERIALGQLLAVKRLVTLTGLGGIGKTRLALAAGRDAIESFPDGVYLVDLAPVSQAESVVPAIAQALALREVPGQSMLVTLGARIGAGRMLLLLDNVEHVPSATPVIRDLLAACPELVLLVTSRVRLQLRGEQVFPVSVLQAPGNAEAVTAAELGTFGATSLFLQRAREVKPDLVVTDSVAPVIAAICQRLDGIPLAVELAAARCRVLSLPALLERLTAALDVLAGGGRDVPRRQQTLRETIAWSEALLSEGEQALFRRLSIFANGWTLEAAEAVCGDLGIDVLDGLMSLVDHGLVYEIDLPAGSIRFRLLETIRAYAGTQLTAGGQSAVAEERHAAWYLRFAEQHDDLYASAGSIRYSWLEQLAIEHDNLRHSLRWYGEQSASEPLLRLSAALVWFWAIRGHFSEGRHWLERALALAANPPSIVAAAALLGLGMLASEQGDWDAATPALSASLTRFREHDDSRGVIAVQNSQGITAARQGDRETAIALFSAALASARALDIQPPIGDLLNNLGVMSIQGGDVDRARELYEESLTQHRAAGLLHHAGGVLLNLGWIALYEGRLAESLPFAVDAMAIARSFGDQVRTVEALNVLGALAVHQGRQHDAQVALVESLTLSRDLGYLEGAAYALEVLATAAIACDTVPAGIQLFAAASTLRQTAAVPNNPQDAARTEQARASAHAIVGDEAFESAWTSGRRLSLDEAIAIARSFGNPDVSSAE
jgi:predicted ATPase